MNGVLFRERSRKPCSRIFEIEGERRGERREGWTGRIVVSTIGKRKGRRERGSEETSTRGKETSASTIIETCFPRGFVRYF